MRVAWFALLCLLAAHESAASQADTRRWQAQVARVYIIRDNWGIPHVYGRTDADAVFGSIYAQAEDDFDRVEHNYLVSLGWLAQVEGESAVYGDLRARLFTDTARLKRLRARAPAWLGSLMDAWADGLNYYLAKHPEVHPKLIRRFEPWMALAFTEGSIGGDVEDVDLGRLREFYAPAERLAASIAAPIPAPPEERAAGGSNGFAIAPGRSASGHALLWINPHTSYYFRSELQMVSGEGLNAYGAVTWGQFFVYQGFNARNGWMHTSYGGDATDEYAEDIVRQRGSLHYRYGDGLRRLGVERIVVPFKRGARIERASFTVFRSHHGPIVRAEHGRWIAFRMLQEPVRALEQSWLRTKTADYAGFRKTQEMRTDTSNNTVYADADGTIAYFHGNFIPRRDPRFDFRHPVDGSNPATEWQGPHALAETITLLNPSTGWIMNTNNWPFSAAGAASPRREDYPAYMWTQGENARGLHALEVLRDIHDVTLESLIAAAYDGHLTAFDALLPPLLAAFDALAKDDARRGALEPVVACLRGWDRRTSKESVATALAIYWGQALVERKGGEARRAGEPVVDYLAERLSDAERLDALVAATDTLRRDFGRWQVPWGEINRFQRLTGDIVQRHDDDQPSLPVGFAPAQWGALASFDGVRPRTTRRIYGAVGNSFVAAVEFGPTVHARAILSGGESGHPDSPHFADQALMFSEGRLREVLFYPSDVAAHAERRYHP